MASVIFGTDDDEEEEVGGDDTDEDTLDKSVVGYDLCAGCSFNGGGGVFAAGYDKTESG